ncbi:MAG: hypothetical protein J1F35_06285 [Erysipelotrichales bacterium]|nr:hypothetical protein [Erysipelotrichales bacterium]
MISKAEALMISDQINLFLNRNELTEKVFKNPPCEIIWDNDVSEWNYKDIERCKKEFLENQNKFISDYHKIDDDNYGIIISYKDSVKIN